jgi:dihydrofolate synthase / folylpolyglutamate synthase
VSSNIEPGEALVFDSYEDFIERLYAQNQFAMKLGLEAMQTALEACGHPEREHRCILVAGTNGKGTTAAYLAGILQAHGFKVGLYTSPHLIDLRERFRIDGCPVDESLTFEVGRRVMERFGVARGERAPLTFFELTTLMATVIFARSGVDVAVYEIGLGGRLDAVNAIEPELSVVTTIDFDHMQYLGDTIEAIAAEKCGIFRAGIPAIIGYQDHPEALQVCRDRAQARGCASVRSYGADFDSSALGPAGCVLPEVTARNVATSVAAARQFLGESFSESLAIGGIERVRWPGRLEHRVVPVGDLARVHVLFDAAHNPAGVAVLEQYLDQQSLKVGAVVCGVMKDKDFESMFRWLTRRPWPVFASIVGNARSATESELRRALTGANLQHVGSAMECLTKAADRLEGGEVIVVFGSIYLLGECLSVIGIGPDDLITYVC